MPGEDVLDHVTEGTQVRVQQSKGQTLHITASSHIPLSPQQTFALVMHPKNEQIFKHIDRCVDWSVLEDDGAGRVVVQSTHLASWRFFVFSGCLSTRLRVEQDFNACTARFVLLPTRFSPLRRFEGSWAAGADGGGCRLRLDQELQPAGFLLPPLGRLLKHIACNQVRGVFEDLREEAGRIHAGTPTLGGGGTAAAEG